MYQLIKTIFIVILAGVLATFFVLSSIVFGKAEDLVKTETSEDTIKSYYISQGKNEAGVTQLQYADITSGTGSVGKNSALYTEFGRLASIFSLPQDKNQAMDMLTKSGTTITLSRDTPVIVSLYDPFTLYTIYSAQGEYSIDEVTNGSFYVGKESDNTISVYSIDAVIRLNFLYEGSHMADIVLFPGMYIRFNPTFNRIFKGVIDPFRVAQVVESDDSQSNEGNTGIEFINPRVDGPENSDNFFVYRLPIETRVLFQLLHTLFHDRVAEINIMKSYADNMLTYSEASMNPWLINPSKVNHFLLLELKGALSKGLQSQTTVSAFTQKIQEIKDRAETLAIGNSVDQTFEDFLTRGRFALFGGSLNSSYSEVYQSVASIMEIAPTTGKSRLFQKLSDIYSHNLVTRKKDLTFSQIDTYSPTATELYSTLGSSDINHKDFFDIALYAYSILNKAQGKDFFESQAITSHATYELLSTLFVSTGKYASSVEDAEQRQKTYRSIAIHFYDPILRVLTRSLYNHFTTVDQGHIYLGSNALNVEGRIKMTRNLIQDIKSIDSIIQGIGLNLQPAYANETDVSTYMSIKKSALQIRGLAGILDDTSYESYLLAPYIGENDGYIDLPKTTEDNASILVDPIQQEEVQ